VSSSAGSRARPSRPARIPPD